MTDQDRLTSALEKWTRAKRGERRVISHRELDLMGEHFQASDSADAAHYFNASRTIWNPARVGTLDAFILYL